LIWRAGIRTLSFVTYGELGLRLERHARSVELLELLGMFVASRQRHPDRQILVTKMTSGMLVHLGSGNAKLDPVLLQELLDWGLVQRDYFGREAAEHLVVTEEAVAFYDWFLANPKTPIGTVEQEVLRLVDGDGFAKRHPAAAEALAEAFRLVRRGLSDDADFAAVGQHLRAALTSGVQASVRLTAPTTAPTAERVDAAMQALVALADKVIDLADQLTSASRTGPQDQTHRRARADIETVRRAAFLTAVACYELDRTSSGR
jgi:hypothetical protein